MAKKFNNDNEILSAYATEQDMTGINADSNDAVKTEQTAPRTMAQAVNTQVPTSTATIANRNVQGEKPTLQSRYEDGTIYKDNLGYMRIELNTLPTGGLFYPEGTIIRIRAARGAEIKHWSTMNDQDLDQLSQVDDILNYIIEKCVNVEIPGMISSWKDLKDIDRFYLLLAVREFTFLDGDNELMVPISENKSIPVTKEMIDFIKIPEEIMKFYSPEEKCFLFHLPSKDLRMYIPSLGASQWLKNYAQNKVNAREGFDSDFLLFAPMLINDFRLLSQRTYEQMVEETTMWSVKEWSLISYVRDTLAAASQPKLTYTDDDGKEVTIPLTFRGGLKALFTLQDPLSVLR